jgi:hypothetical protein
MYYHIRVKEHLDPHWQEWFAGMQVVQEPSATSLLSGPLPDQAALFGVLLTINRLGLTLLSLETLESAGSQEAEGHSEDDINGSAGNLSM